MTSSYTMSNTFTITHARYITSKIAADLRQLRLFYGSPSDQQVDDYAEEAALLLRDGYLERVDYGFRSVGANGESKWLLVLRYIAKNGAIADDYSGRIPARVNVGGATFWSFLTYTAPFFGLSNSDRARVKAALPIERTSGREAEFVNGSWSGDRSYSSAEHGVARSVFKPL
ncbi:MAG TPA: hypothetical protein VGL75_03285 [Acidothermaceae bacterium]